MEKEKENNEGKCMVSNAVYLCKGYQIKKWTPFFFNAKWKTKIQLQLTCSHLELLIYNG